MIAVVVVVVLNINFRDPIDIFIFTDRTWLQIVVVVGVVGVIIIQVFYFIGFAGYFQVQFGSSKTPSAS